MHWAMIFSFSGVSVSSVTDESFSSFDNRFFLSSWGTFTTKLGPLAGQIHTLAMRPEEGGVPERWADALYQARGLTQEHTAQIRKLAGDRGSGIRRKNKMPYFLATLEQLVGLRPEPPSPEVRSGPSG